MSVSTNGILYWGIELGEEFHGDYDGINEAWRKDREPQKPENKDRKSPEWDAWRKALSVWEETSGNVFISTHCSGEYPMYFVTTGKHFYLAMRGCPIKVDPEKLVITDEDRRMLTEFMEFGHIAYQEEPRWTLCSDWN